MYIWHIALKYLKSEGHKSISFGNIISIIGIFLGVFALIVVMSVMNGMEHDITNRIIGLHSEIKIYQQNLQPIKNWQNILPEMDSFGNKIQISPVIQGELMLMRDKFVTGTICQGIELDRHIKATRLKENIYLGYPQPKDLKSGIILGSDVALSLRSNIGDTVTLTSPIADQPTAFGLLPKSQSFEIVALFHTGIPEYDMKYSFINLETLQKFLGKNNQILF